MGRHCGNQQDRIETLRRVALQQVLRCTGAARDPYDKNKWHTPVGAISVTGCKFFNWNRGRGGGGAIDLVIHLLDCDFKAALSWLADRFTQPGVEPFSENCCPPAGLKLPQRDDSKLHQIRRYLTGVRCLPAGIIESLLDSGQLYADGRSNAVFLLLGKEKAVVGAELRGTTAARWRGMAPGSRKELGYFAAGHIAAARIALTESAIDAISCHILHPDSLAVSTSGANPNPAWLPFLINQGRPILCGFDSDATGDAIAHLMMQRHPTIQRLRPPMHDWNDVLLHRFKSGSRIPF
jgi:hypothetical protein